MSITSEPWVSHYKPKTDAELLERANRSGWTFLRGETFASMKDTWGWKEGNCLHGYKKGSNPADYLRASESPSTWWSDRGKLITSLMFEHDLDCTYCGTPICFDNQEHKEQMLKNVQCSCCFNWHQTLKQPNIWVCESQEGDLSAYEVPADYRSKGKYLGFGGAEWCLSKLDGTVVHGNNLWHKGRLDRNYMPIVERMGILTFCNPDGLPENQTAMLANLPLLVLADWLEEGGRPNTAGFIRNTAFR